MKIDTPLPVTQLLADFVSRQTYDRLPARVREEAVLAIADTVGGAFGAVPEALTQSMLAVIAGEQGTSPVWGLDVRTTPRNAALVNGTLAHTHDIDDTNPSMRGHPSCPVVPAVFALAPMAKADGKAIIAAYVAGVEIATKVGRAVNMEHYNRGWHTTPTLGCLGAAAASASLLRLDPARTATTLAIASSMAGGLVANFGTQTKPVHSGFAAQNGILAALLARSGVTANPTAMEAKTGFFDLFCGLDQVQAALALEKLDERYDLIEPGNIYKLYPTCSLAHCAIDAILDGLARGTIDPSQIESIECAVGYRCENTLPHHRPTTGLEGKFSMEYCLAAALVYRQVTFDEFVDAKVNDPRIAAIYDKLNLYIHPDLRTPDSVPRDFTDIVIRHRDGRVFHDRSTKAKGDPAKRWTRAEFKGKFVRCAGIVLGAEEAGKRWDRMQALAGLGAAEIDALFAPAR